MSDVTNSTRYIVLTSAIGTSICLRTYTRCNRIVQGTSTSV